MPPAPMPESPAPILAIQGVGIRFGGLAALNGVSFTIAPGEIRRPEDFGLTFWEASAHTRAAFALLGFSSPFEWLIDRAGIPPDTSHFF